MSDDRTDDPATTVTLTLLTYLAPSLPSALFEGLAAHLGAHVGTDVELRFDASRSGPRRGEPEPFSSGEVDAAWLCATSYVWLTEDADPPIRLVGGAWVPTDARAGGEAIYFGDVLAPAGRVRSLAELAGRRVAYNDDVSLSGYHSLRLALHEAGVATDTVGFVRSGSHLRSLELLTEGAVDAATIDSNVWRRRAREQPDLRSRLTSVATLGPHPVQPFVARSTLDLEVASRLCSALLAAHEDPEVAERLEHAGFARFVPVEDDHYGPLRLQMGTQGLLAGAGRR